MVPNAERAKRVIFEIVRQNGGAVARPKLPTLFWLAHLYYSKAARGFLSDWPIVKAPAGPEIGQGDQLLDEMVLAGNLTRGHAPVGPFIEACYRQADKSLVGGLRPEAETAVQEAIQFLGQNPTLSAGDLARARSRSWRDARDGEELDIYSDLIPDRGYEEQGRDLEEMRKAYENLLA